MSVLIPLVQGRFLFSKHCFSSFISMGWNASFQVLGSWKSCCIFTTLVVLGRLDGGGVWGLSSLMEGRFLVRWMLVSSRGTLYAIYRAMFVEYILFGLGILCFMYPVYPFYAGTICC